MDALNQRRDHKNTVIVFWSDHGDSLGRYGFATKYAFFIDEVIRVPLAFHIPGKQATAARNPVSLIDLFPTLCELAGLPVSQQVEGISLLPFLDPGKVPPTREIEIVWREPFPHERLRATCTVSETELRIHYPDFDVCYIEALERGVN